MGAYILILIVMVLLGWQTSRWIKPHKGESSIIRIDDKNWIVNNEFVSYEEDTPLLRHRQVVEDNKHYREYEHDRLMTERNIIWDEWVKTIKAINDIPHLLDEIDEGVLEDVTPEYEKYVEKCKKLEESVMLTKKEFAVKEKNSTFCTSFGAMFVSPMASTYTIHNDKTAKYKDGNMRAEMKKEFEEKWF